MGFDHATVSRRIARLEQAFEHQLFEHRQSKTQTATLLGFRPKEAAAPTTSHVTKKPSLVLV
jgi:hypothetical protein